MLIAQVHTLRKGTPLSSACPRPAQGYLQSWLTSSTASDAKLSWALEHLFNSDEQFKAAVVQVGAGGTEAACTSGSVRLTCVRACACCQSADLLARDVPRAGAAVSVLFPLQGYAVYCKRL